MSQKWPDFQKSSCFLHKNKNLWGQFFEEISKFGNFKKLEKVRIKLQWPRKLAAEMIKFVAK